MLTDSDREAILKALADEQRLKVERKPYSEAVITACEVALRVFARARDRGLEATNQMRREVQPIDDPLKDYWWMRD